MCGFTFTVFLSAFQLLPTAPFHILALAGFSLAYALIPSYRVTLALVLVHGIFWSGLLSASAAYLTNMLPERRRAEGIAYWGLSSIAAIAVAPPIGFWVFRHGWGALCIESA